MQDNNNAKPDAGRRRFLTGSAAGLAGLALGTSGLGSALNSANAQTPGRGERYAGRVVLITGATSGIGAATARLYARLGAQVFFCGRRENLGNEVEASIREAGGEATYMQADVREEAQMKDFVAKCLDTYGGLNIAFNNAGIEGPAGDLDSIALDGANGYQDVFRTNTHGVFHALRHEIPVMRSQGGGVIINTASMLAHRGSASAGAYTASKHAVIGLTRSAAKQEVANGIRVISISPGSVRTDLLRRFRGGSLEGADSSHPMGRIAEPDDIAQVVINLTAPEASYLNGDDIRIDGTQSA